MCEWRSKLNLDYRCRVPPELGSRYCIFHQSGEKAVEKFEEKFYEQIDKKGGKGKTNSQYDFRGYVFPPMIISGWGGKRGGNMLALPKEISGKIVWDEAKISNDILLWKTTIIGDVSFGKATIEGGVGFGEARIEGSVYFNESVVENDVIFDGGTIVGAAIFYDAIIKGDFRFHIEGFKGRFEFGGAKVGGLVDLADAVFVGDTGFLSCEAANLYLGEEKPTIAWWVRNRCGIRIRSASAAYAFWKFARRAFSNAENRTGADAAYYFEQVWARKARVARGGWDRVWAILGYPFEVVLLRLPFAYGISIARIATSWGIVICFFAGLYAAIPSLLGRTIESVWALPNWITAFHFSVTTFTTLGLGDIKPTRLLGKGLTSIEAVFGGVLMALTVVVISRKFMR